ncbi:MULTISPECIES: hypothetical protein [unclassified Lentimonas]|uniref:hypothetical protein n=1 Tax=unclassified Lentimonas TaxID=2630993 RepID=UPI001322A2E9|nr:MULTISPECIES: hypothetical protein [unclassified Lentimonas]CAA6679040.1 Unannotated [Lentimonas sp. CC4]CAA6684220.1 Unannotated [Lentimonas sp. CC6]CAA7076407.1 Unannotated [Lentimonas sp. CC4]CAA7171832.1 Unannotated [Lentimonas sp. CC21]CAA7183162.1 Unannotated [Lentimonas sp. CC8]
MNTIKTLIISALAFGLLLVVSGFAGLRLVPVMTHLLLPGLIVAIHVVSAIALFKESKRRKEAGGALFADLDAPFWGMIGLAFGVLGLLAFRLLNDCFKGESGQSR